MMLLPTIYAKAPKYGEALGEQLNKKVKQPTNQTDKTGWR